MKSLRHQIKERVSELTYDTDRTGPGSATTQPSHISSSRLTIYNNNVSHAENIKDPDVPLILTGLENRLASYSSTIVKADATYEVVRRFMKNKFHYWTLVFDKKNKKYHIFERNQLVEMSENLTSPLNNEVLDEADEGDVIKAGTTVIKSKSFDEHGNYRPGKNLNTCYLINLNTMEDGVALMNGAEKMMRSVRSERYRVSISDNEVLLNLYGTDKKYKSFPGIDEKIIDGMLLGKRETTAITSITAMNNRELSRINALSDTIVYGEGRVIDIDLYTNKTRDQFVESAINKQMIDIYDEQLEFYREVYTVLKDLIDNAEEKGYTYSREVTVLFAKARDHIDAGTYRSKYGENIFGNTIIEFHVMYTVPLLVGSKIVGQCGNKGVITKIFSESKSWTTEDGRPIHAILNGLGIVGRLNPTIFDNLAITDIAMTAVSVIKETKSLSEKFRLLFEFLDFVNEEQATKWRKYVKELDTNEKEKFIRIIEKGGIHVFQPPLDNINIVDVEKMYNHYGYKPTRLKFPDGTLSLYPVVVAPQYFLRMKQDPVDKFSARGRGTINPMTQLPSRSADMKHGTDVVSNTPVQFGKFEHEVLGICKFPQAISLFMGVHATSMEAMTVMDTFYYEKLTENKLIDIIKAMSKSNKKNNEIITAWLTLIGTAMDISYLEDVNWGTDEPPTWRKV